MNSVSFLTISDSDGSVFAISFNSRKELHMSLVNEKKKKTIPRANNAKVTKNRTVLNVIRYSNAIANKYPMGSVSTASGMNGTLPKYNEIGKRCKKSL